MHPCRSSTLLVCLSWHRARVTGQFRHSAQMTFAYYAIAPGAHALEPCRVIAVDHPARTVVGGVDTALQTELRASKS